MPDASLLLVDDRAENLLTLRAILEPLGHELVTARSGDEALRVLLRRTDFAAVLLDVQMQDLDGFQVAEVIKQRSATSAIPIIFLTAISKEDRNVFHGYEVGAVDYVFKPFEPEILRAKVSVFVELWDKTQQIRLQAERLAQQELDELRRASAERYRQLADAMPQIVWTADADGRTTYFNRRWFDYTGLSPDTNTVVGWEVALHPADRKAAVAARKRSLATGGRFEAEFRFRAADGTYRWHLGRAVPIRDDEGDIDFWIGTATDIDDRKRIEDAQRFLLDASAELSRSLDWRAGLRAVAELASARVAGRCRVDIVEADGSLTRLAVEGTPRTADRAVAEEVVARRTPHLAPTLLSVPLLSRDRVFGAITLGASRGDRLFDDGDLRTAEQLALRAGTMIENAELYEEVEHRARAARALETIADGVVLLDPSQRVLLWNSAAAQITGLAAGDVTGRTITEVLPGVPAGPEDARPRSVPVEIGGRELWLSFSGVRFEDGTVYAFRDLTEERVIEQMRSDFVATVSHELRTPLAAIYGAAVTLRRPDLNLAEELRDRLLAVVGDESERLAQIVNDVLLASHLDSGQLHLRIETVEATRLTEGVVEAARTHLPEGVTIALEAPKRLPPVAADEQQLSQVLSNLVENAVKYSPDGGPVAVKLSRSPHAVRWTVSDRGLGIPASERRRIFEKFYRLDPNMTRGIGGTGLGLYICRELVRRLDGRVWVEPNGRRGSTFVVEIPTAEQPARRGAVRTAA
jgi:PAS domain S-box-containing protein